MIENYFDVITDILPLFCVTPCTVKIKGEGLTKGGAEKWLPEQNLKCHYQQVKQTRTYSDKSVGSATTGFVYFAGDIAPEVKKKLIGTIEINGVKYDFSGEKFGVNNKVNYTMLTLE